MTINSTYYHPRFRKSYENLARIVARGFESVDGRFQQVDKRFDQVDGKLEHIDARLDTIERDLVEIM